MPGSSVQTDRAEIQAALLGVLAQAETTREAATAILAALIPALEAAGSPDVDAAALAVRDRDGVTLHVLAQAGEQRPWPASIEPRFSVGALSGVEAATGAVIIPLRANGRIVGALLIIDAIFATAIQRDPVVAEVLQTAAIVLEELASRTDGVITRRAHAMRSVESVIEGLAHQLANPLTGASAMAQLLAEELEGEPQAAVKQIVAELARATVVLRDLSDFHRQTGAQAGILDLNTVAEGIARFRGYAIREQGISFEFEATSRPAPVRVDGRSLEHALLLALRHAELQARDSASRTISMRVVERDAGDVRLEITDSGAATVTDIASSYFDVRFRDEQAGVGAATDDHDLGLAASVVHRAGGRLEARCTRTEGTTLTFVFPRAVTQNYSAQGRTI
ncbi:MAG: sensor histidine kinase [Gemmatimonadaceae bacterium]